MRVNLWEDKLVLFIEEKRNLPFNWKENNCGFFACDWLAIVVQVDPAALLREMTPLQLCRFVRKTPLDTFAQELATQYNWPEVKPAFARRGDIVAIGTENGPALGVCIGGRSVFPGRDGIMFVATLKCSRAWRIE